MFLGEASYRPRTGLVQASYRPRTGTFYRRLEKRRRLRRLFSPWRLKVSTALVCILLKRRPYCCSTRKRVACRVPLGIVPKIQESLLWHRPGKRARTQELSAGIPFICHRHHRRCLCKKELPGVNFYRFNAKNWQFTV